MSPITSVYYTRACGCLCMRAYVYELKIVSPDKSWRHTRIIVVTTTTRVLARRIARTAPLAWGKRDGQIRAHLARETRSNVDSSVGRDQMWIAQLAERPMKKSQAYIILTRVRVPGGVRDFSQRVNFRCRLSGVPNSPRVQSHASTSSRLNN